MERSTVQSCLAAPFFGSIAHRSAFSRPKTPEFCSPLSPSSVKRAQGRPGADGHPRSAARKCSARRPHSSIQVTPNTRPSLRSGVTAYTRSPRSRVPSGLRHLANWRCPATRLSPKASPQGLTVATTVRTTRFRRTQLLCFAPKGLFRVLAPSVPLGAEISRGSSRPGPAYPCPALPRPPHPGPRSLRRTSAPLPGSGCGENAVIPKFGKVEYFCGKGLTRFCGRPGVLPDGTSGPRR